jgi:hypothetical protein
METLIAVTILPVYGEGDHEVVEGVIRKRCLLAPPSVSPMGCHLPMNGEDFR